MGFDEACVEAKHYETPCGVKTARWTVIRTASGSATPKSNRRHSEWQAFIPLFCCPTSVRAL
jgi:hypothetical protein